MLRQRVVTGLVLVAGFLAAIVFVPLPGLAVIFGFIVTLGGWEWARMAGWQSNVSRGLYAFILAATLGGVYVYCGLGASPQDSQVQPFLGLACLWWSVAMLWVKSYPASGALWGNMAMRSLMGLLILAPAWLAAVYLLSFARGGMLMVAMILIVVTADIGAYFSGKTFGKHKLAPEVSPAKTWEGFWGGVLACFLLSLAGWYLLPVQKQHIGLISVVTVVLITGVASVIGDLTVSMVKRQSGIKDSGNILPGHGGVLDRLDSIAAAAPVFALGLLMVEW
jgi:phosphatidate cytidylyltransferase